MERKVLSDASVHPEALQFMAQNHAETVNEVMSAIAKNKIVVVGMAHNPFVKKARNLLDEKKLEYIYLAYGNYFSKWKPRLAIKIWSGWPTYPQIFFDGKLIGGFKELSKFLDK
ncbi:MAG: glutaredoxin [Bdellovibrionales bacterium]|nr:glutaredoxin [Bdellovibrionales bacterium]